MTQTCGVLWTLGLLLRGIARLNIVGVLLSTEESEPCEQFERSRSVRDIRPAGL